MTNWKKLLSLIICVALLVCLVPLRANASDFPTVLAEAKKGVVQVYGLGSDGFFLTSWIGTGFAVGEMGKPSNIFLTNWHVITGDGEYDLEDVRIWILQENCQIDNRTGEPDPNKSITCEVLKTTTGYPDYAIIRATETVTDYLPLALMSSKDILDGTTVYALGYPAVVGSISASHYGIDDITATDGIISQHMQYAAADNTWVLMHTAQISGGNSGGPLITGDGVVVGLNTYGFGENEANMNRYCAVYIDYAIEGLDELNLPYTLAGASAPVEATEEAASEEAPVETTEAAKEDDSEEKAEDEEESDEEANWVLIIAASCGSIVVLLAIILIVLKKKKDEQRRLEAERRFQAEQRRQEEERHRQAEAQRRQEEERRRLEAQRRQAQLKKEQEVKAQVQLSGGPVYPVRASGCLIGRDRDCNIILPENTSGVSRHHCKLEHQGGQLILVDLNSTYGTYIHGKRIPANTPVALKAGSSFCLGSEKCKFTVC